jgi:hypothetical protein
MKKGDVKALYKKNRAFVVVFLLIGLLVLLPSGFSASVSACSNNVRNNIELTAHVNHTGTCFYVTRDDVVIDCQGYTINYSTSGILGYGVNNSGFDNVTIQNCNFVEGSEGGEGKHGIYFNGGNGTVFNNTVTVIGRASHGLHVEGGSVLNITGNNMSAVGGEGHALSANHANNLTVFVNVLNATGSKAHAMVVYATNNTLSENNTLFSSGSYGQSLLANASDQVTITANHMEATGTGGNAIFFNATNNSFADMNNITTTGTQGHSILLTSSSDLNNVSENIVNNTGTLGRAITLRRARNTTINANRIEIKGKAGEGIRLEDSSTTNSIVSNNVTLPASFDREKALTNDSTSLNNNYTANRDDSDALVDEGRGDGSSAGTTTKTRTTRTRSR